MATAENDPALQATLRQVLQNAGNPISYGALARVVDAGGPGAIGRVIAALHVLMQDDMAAGRPFLAAMCQGRLSDGMPALGFFQMAIALGRYSGPVSGPEAIAFVAHQRRQLQKK